MHQVILCLYGSPKPSIPTLQGRSGTVYGRAYWNDKTARHECGPFDLPLYHNTIVPDVAALRASTPQQWFAVVKLDEDAQTQSALLDEIDRLKAHISELTAGTDTPPQEASAEAEPATEPISPPPLVAHTVRELRAMCKERNIPIPTGASKEELLDLLEAKVMG